MDSDHIATFEEHKAARLAEKSKNGGKRPKCAPAYDPSQEMDPDHAWFRLQREHKDQQVRDIADMVTGITTIARPEDKELHSIHKSAKTVRDIALAASTEVALVGQQGMGKSLMINALTNRRDLSKTSARVGACTATPIKYRHKSGASDTHELYDAVVQFMDDDCLREIASEHIRRYTHFHHSGNVDQENWFDEKCAADTALKFFEEIFNTQFDAGAKEQLDRLLQKDRIINNDLLEAAVTTAHQRIAETGAGDERVINFEGMWIDDLMKEVDGYVSDTPDQSSLWPIVQDVAIYMGSNLARNGVCLIDLPGLGDLNQSRTAATNAIRRSASFELIIAKSERVVTEGVVDQQLRQSIKAHGAKNTILVLTQIDQYFVDNHSIETEINKSKVHPFPLIRRYHHEAENKVDDLELDGSDTADEELDHISTYQEYLLQVAQHVFIKQRAQDIEKEMRERFLDEDPDPIEVFSISASMYLDWLKERRKKRPTLTAEMTGIPALRQFLLGLSAEGNFAAYKEHIAVKLPMFLDKIRRIAYNEKKDDGYVIIRPRFQQLVASLRNVLEIAFEAFLKERLDHIWQDDAVKDKRLGTFVNIVEEWGDGIAWNTYSKVVREKGIVARTQAKKYVPSGKSSGSVNWNEELSVEALPDMGAWKRRMNQAVASFARDVDNYTIGICEKVLASITMAALTPDLKRVAVEEWTKRQTRILENSKSCEKVLRGAINLTYQYATTETDTRCMIAQVNREAYSAVEATPRGTGFFQAQRDRMYSQMQTPDSRSKTLLDRISSAVRKNATNNLRLSFGNFLGDLVAELELFDEHIGERLPADYALTPHDFALRNQLKALLPELQNRVQGLRTEFDVGEDSESDEEAPAPDSSSAGDGGAGPSKPRARRAEEDVGEPLTKKVKTAETPAVAQAGSEAPKVKVEDSGVQDIWFADNGEILGMRDDDSD